MSNSKWKKTVSDLETLRYISSFAGWSSIILPFLLAILASVHFWTSNEIQKREKALSTTKIETLETNLANSTDEIAALKEDTRATFFRASPTKKERRSDGNFLQSFRLEPVGENIIPIFTIEVTSEEPRKILSLVVKGATLPLIAEGNHSKNGTSAFKRYRSVAPGQIDVEILVSPTNSDVAVTVFPLEADTEDSQD